MFASFGSITFELLNSPQSLEETNEYKYEVIPVINGTPRVQRIYDGVEQLSLAFVFHQQFTNPLEAIARRGRPASAEPSGSS